MVVVERAVVAVEQAPCNDSTAIKGCIVLKTALVQRRLCRPRVIVVTDNGAAAQLVEVGGFVACEITVEARDGCSVEDGSAN